LRALLIALALGVSLIAGSTPRAVGDGGEYLAMALNLAAFRGPAIAARDATRLESLVGLADGHLSDWDLHAATVPGVDHRRDFVHFWFYPLLAVPGIWITTLVGANPILGFAFLNLTLLGLAFYLALPRIGASACLLLFAGPVIWWIDKPHTEAFTFALLVIAFVLMPDRPGWATVAAGAAATQNPPIALVAILTIGGATLANGARWRDRRFLACVVAGLALALLQPGYTWWRHGTPSLLLNANPTHTPTLAELAAVPLDPDVGLIGSYPMLVVLFAGATWIVLRRNPRALLTWTHATAVIAGAAFLMSFAQATNVHHGGTPGMSRYAVWLVPLTIPFFADAHALATRSWKRVAWGGALASALICTFMFHPAVPQLGRDPTALADWLWTHRPGWYNPLPEVFAEVLTGDETRAVPVATANCEKVLIAGNADGGVWPIPCFPQTLPQWCTRPGALCYANRVGSTYQFVRPPGGALALSGFGYESGRAWPRDAEPFVRALFSEWEWWTLRPNMEPDNVLRASNDVRVLELEGPHRWVFVLRHPGPAASMAFRLPGHATGAIVDASTGRTLTQLQYDGEPFERWEVRLPTGFDVLLLSLTPA
jgi:hypothetical protein